MHALGYAHHYGTGARRDYAEAIRWYRRAADRGWRDSMYNLGVMYEAGTGVPRSQAEAVKWYKKAAALGDAEAKARVRLLERQ
jgi:TPR repeat protein